MSTKPKRIRRRRQCAVCGDCVQLNVARSWRRTRDNTDFDVCLACAEAGAVDEHSVETYPGGRVPLYDPDGEIANGMIPSREPDITVRVSPRCHGCDCHDPIYADQGPLPCPCDCHKSLSSAVPCNRCNEPTINCFRQGDQVAVWCGKCVAEYTELAAAGVPFDMWTKRLLRTPSRHTPYTIEMELARLQGLADIAAREAGKELQPRIDFVNHRGE